MMCRCVFALTNKTFLNLPSCLLNDALETIKRSHSNGEIETYSLCQPICSSSVPLLLSILCAITGFIPASSQPPTITSLQVCRCFIYLISSCLACRTFFESSWSLCASAHACSKFHTSFLITSLLLRQPQPLPIQFQHS